MTDESINIFWFRRDLRLNDNAGFYHALTAGHKVQPIFIFDKTILEKLEDKQDRRVGFIYEQIERLKKELAEHDADLWVYHDSPSDVFSRILKGHDIHELFANKDYEPHARERDKSIYDLCAEHGVRFRAFKDQVIFEKDEILKENGDPYTVFTPYSKKWRAKVNDSYLKPYQTEEHLANLNQTGLTELISLDAMGFLRHKNDWSSQSLDESLVKNYHNTRDIPAIEGTTRMSVHLRFGTVSIRSLALKGKELNPKWYTELMWRDFYQSILWHFPHVAKKSFKPKYDRIKWRNNETEFEAWCNGKTGYPIVDAGMRELNKTGFMHNRVRMIVSSFLTKHLLIDWRWGEAYFAKKLLDFDLASNNGGWQWAAGSGVDAAPYFRIFNPYLQTDKFDPDKKYIRKWVPEFGTDEYPEPIVEHKEGRERALETYKRCLAG